MYSIVFFKKESRFVFNQFVKLWVALDLTRRYVLKEAFFACCLIVFCVLLHAALPYFLRMLKDVQVQEKEDAHFFCEVFPDDAHVKWYITDTQISPCDKYTMLLKGPERHLHIKEANKEDEGHVSVMIGDDLKSSARLSVEGMLNTAYCCNQPFNY